MNKNITASNQGSGRKVLAGATVLMVDQDPRVVDGLAHVLSASGAEIIKAHDSEQAQRAAKGTAITVAVIDAEIPEGGLELVEVLKHQSPESAIIVLTTRPSFDLAVAANRLGAADVVLKSPDNVKHLLDRVIDLCRRARKRDERNRLFNDVLSVHEQFLQRMIDTARKATMAEEQIQGEAPARDQGVCQILVVDNDPEMAAGLQRALGSSQIYRVVGAFSGGEALDQGSAQSFQMVLINDSLSDVPTETVADMIEGGQEECTVLIFSMPDGHSAGRVELFERGQRAELIPTLTDGGQLVNQVFRFWTGRSDKTKEHRYLRAFRHEHDDFLKLYVKLRRRLVEFLDKQH